MIQAFPFVTWLHDFKLNSVGQIAREQTLPELVAQRIKSRLLTVKGQCLFDQDAGLPLFSEMTVMNPNIVHLEALIRAEILKVRDVASVTTLSVEVDNPTATLKVTFAGKCSDGTTYQGSTN